MLHKQIKNTCLSILFFSGVLFFPKNFSTLKFFYSPEEICKKLGSSAKTDINTRESDWLNNGIEIYKDPNELAYYLCLGLRNYVNADAVNKENLLEIFDRILGLSFKDVSEEYRYEIFNIFLSILRNRSVYSNLINDGIEDKGYLSSLIIDGKGNCKTYAYAINRILTCLEFKNYIMRVEGDKGKSLSGLLGHGVNIVKFRKKFYVIDFQNFRETPVLLEDFCQFNDPDVFYFKNYPYYILESSDFYDPYQLLNDGKKNPQNLLTTISFSDKDNAFYVGNNLLNIPSAYGNLIQNIMLIKQKSSPGVNCSVIVSQSVKQLSPNAFSNIGLLTQIDLSKTSITELPDECFSCCNSLSKVTLPKTFKTISQSAFRNIDFKKIEFVGLENSKSAFKNKDSLLFMKGIYDRNKQLSIESKKKCLNTIEEPKNPKINLEDTVSFKNDEIIIGKGTSVINSDYMFSLSQLYNLDKIVISSDVTKILNNSFTHHIFNTIRFENEKRCAICENAFDHVVIKNLDLNTDVNAFIKNNPKYFKNCQFEKISGKFNDILNFYTGIDGFLVYTGDLKDKFINYYFIDGYGEFSKVLQVNLAPSENVNFSNVSNRLNCKVSFSNDKEFEFFNELSLIHDFKCAKVLILKGKKNSFWVYGITIAKLRYIPKSVEVLDITEFWLDPATGSINLVPGTFPNLKELKISESTFIGHLQACCSTMHGFSMAFPDVKIISDKNVVQYIFSNYFKDDKFKKIITLNDEFISNEQANFIIKTLNDTSDKFNILHEKVEILNIGSKVKNFMIVNHGLPSEIVLVNIPNSLGFYCVSEIEPKFNNIQFMYVKKLSNLKMLHNLPFNVVLIIDEMTAVQFKKDLKANGKINFLHTACNLLESTGLREIKIMKSGAITNERLLDLGYGIRAGNATAIAEYNGLQTMEDYYNM
ncbi:MAG: Leu-rich repeat protein [Candidatus Paraimprobicoccus trichonymphae]|uniref:Leu-rich repeat protein n=1 Tax=Candidatus Paraimprobicoccus trichonymphae TaxID=3033793 RepID=A0AA48L1E9_9FIRM|nr:MAG: Leu-rich repeat protein [Candidatus Paraimprobicoccus trichonymphae]